MRYLIVCKLPWQLSKFLERYILEIVQERRMLLKASFIINFIKIPKKLIIQAVLSKITKLPPTFGIRTIGKIPFSKYLN